MRYTPLLLAIAASCLTSEGATIYQTSFEPPTFIDGTIDGQDGWAVTGGPTSFATIGGSSVNVMQNGGPAIINITRPFNVDVSDQLLIFSIDARIPPSGNLLDYWAVIGSRFGTGNGQSSIGVGVDNDREINFYVTGVSIWTGVFADNAMWNHFELVENMYTNRASLSYNGNFLVTDVPIVMPNETLVRAEFGPRYNTTVIALYDNFSITSQHVPEPTTATLLMTSLVGLAQRRRRPSVAPAAR